MNNYFKLSIKLMKTIDDTILDFILNLIIKIFYTEH